MRSRAEWALRAAVITALMVLCWRAFAAPTPRAMVEESSRGPLARTLVSATRRPLSALTVHFDSTPGPVERAWLAAIAAAGTEVAWGGERLTPLALAVEPVVEPERRVRVRVSAPAEVSVVLADSLGIVDTVRAREGVSSLLMRTASGALSASAPGTRATADLPTPAAVRRILVVGAAGWESKFAVAALEEAGWEVDALLRVAPGVDVRQGSTLAPDTARHSAVVALDGSAARVAPALARYAAAGGGVVLAGAATRAQQLATITAAVTGRRAQGANAPLGLVGLRRDAVVLDSAGPTPVVAARRAGHGRVLASGYDETWRWRMSPGADGPARHREWWANLIAAVAATAGEGDIPVGGGSDAAPVAALTAVLGPPRAADRDVTGSRWRIPSWLLFGWLLASILGEVASRRWRGLP